ncbi:type VII secretion protein EccB [Saccharopolyspora sp. NPDC003752]
MHSRSDQVQAHSFMTARVVSALVQADPDAPNPPLRRTPLGYVIGLMIAILIVAGFALFGALGYGGALDWRQPGKLIVEKETGIRYLLSTDGTLRPVLNYASARLLGAKDVARVPSSTLADVPRGTPIGIVGAPEALPGKAAGQDLSWLVCASTERDAAGAEHPALKVTVGGSADIAQDGGDRAALVRASDGTEYLVWRDKRMKLGAPWVAPVLGYDSSKALPVRDSWLNAMPAGPGLKPVTVPGLGSQGPNLGGQPAVIGQVFKVDVVGRPTTYHMLTRNGLMPLSQTAAQLALGNPDSPAQNARDLPPAVMASSQVTPPPETMAQLPERPPSLVEVDGDDPCVYTVPGAGDAESFLVSATSDNGVVVAGPGLTRDELTADRIEVKPGSGMLARTLPAPGVPGSGLYLVTDSGAKYPIPDEKAASALGFGLTDAVPVPAQLLSLLPTGPVLSPDKALGGDARSAP